MKLLSTVNHASQPNLFDYTVVDQSQESLGTLHSMWNDQQTGDLEFLGIKTGWLFGSNHVVPADRAQVDEATRTIQVPYLMEKIKDAPSIDADATISDEQEAEIHRYYGLGHGTAPAPARTPEARPASVETKANPTEVKDGKNVEMVLSEEQLKVGKRSVDAGSVRLRKVVHTETVNQPVEIRHEDVKIERIAADQVPAGAKASDFKEQVIDVPLTREEVVASKEAHVTGAVRLHKTEETETQNVSETVRKEEAALLRDGHEETASVDTAGRP